MTGRDLVVTWPKTRALGSYLAELRKAEVEGLQINYRVPSRPTLPCLYWEGRRARCYMVHSGWVRGYSEILAIEFRAAGEVSRVESDAWAGYWPEGNYIVRSPRFFPVRPILMAGFRGFRYWPSELALPEEAAGEAKERIHR